MSQALAAHSVQLVLVLVSLLADPSVGITCYSDHGQVYNQKHDRYPIDCTDAYISCHEHYHIVRGSNDAVYHAGCGTYTMDYDTQMVSAQFAEEGNRECFTDACNTGLFAELEVSHRVCYSADRYPVHTMYISICAKNVTKCYLDRMIGAAMPAFFAGCGECPSYTLYCSTCTTNYCNATDDNKPRVIYVDHPDRQYLFNDQTDGTAVSARCLHLAALAALSLVTVALVRSAAAL